MASAILVAIPCVALGFSAEFVGYVMLPLWAVVLGARREIFGMPTVWQHSRLANLAVAVGSIFGSIIAGFGAYITLVNIDGTAERLSQTTTVLLVGVVLLAFALVVDAWRRRKAKDLSSETVFEFAENETGVEVAEAETASEVEVR